MSILLVGSMGSMGRRYASILRFLNRDFVPVDKDHTEKDILKKAAESTGIIIATPTETHEKLILQFAPLQKPILCEKPVTKANEHSFNEIVAHLRAHKTPFRMMLQYEMLADPISIGPSLYDFYNHGKDGLYWDCMQVIGLSRGQVTVRGESPVWSCKLNGKILNIGHMNAAYIGYVQKWFKKPSQDLSYLADMHEKVRNFENKSL